MEKTRHYVNNLTFQLDVTSRMIYNLIENYFKDEFKNKVTLEEYIVLDTIACYPHVDNNLLAKVLVKPRQSVDKVLASLRRKRLINEVRPRNNEIQLTSFELTLSGEKILNEILPHNDIMVTVMAKFMTESELTSFTKTLLKMRNIVISLSNIDYKTKKRGGVKPRRFGFLFISSKLMMSTLEILKFLLYQLIPKEH